jgi:hypothetical protein
MRDWRTDPRVRAALSGDPLPVTLVVTADLRSIPTQSLLAEIEHRARCGDRDALAFAHTDETA